MELLSKEEKNLVQKIGKELRRLREQAGYTSFESFALEIEMDSGQYGKYERGKNMELFTLYHLLNHHNVRLDQFFERVFEEHRTKDSKIIQMKNNNQS